MNKFGLLLSLSLVPLLATAKPMQYMDIFELEVAGDVQISPDGSRIAYVRRSMDVMKDSTRGSIWLIDSTGENHRPLLADTASYSSPRWSPDGTRLAYITAAGVHGAELHVIWLDGGQSALLTQLPSAPSNLSWSPDGAKIAFSALVESKAPKLATQPKAPKGATWAPGVTVIERLNYKSDGAGFLKNGFSHVFVVPSEGGTPSQLTKGNFNHGGQLSWSPDGSRIVFAANRSNNFEINIDGSDIWSVDLESNALTRLVKRAGPDFSPVYAPDGNHIAFRGMPDNRNAYRHADIFVLNVNSGELQIIEEDLDRHFSKALWRGNEALMVSYNDRGRSVLADLSLAGELRGITDRVGGTGIGRPYTSGSFSVADTGAFAFNYSRPDRPADVGFGREPESVSVLTDLNSDLVAQRALSPIEQLTWKSIDSLEIEGWLAFPPDFDPKKQYPLLLEIHGGPHTAYGPQFSAEVQLYAAAGFVVLYANPRGSTSYGLEFANEINRNYPGDDYHDLITGVETVIKRGYIDETQLFVTGGSGGGVLTTWIIGKTNRFAAAAAAKPVINWISEVLYADLTAFATQYWFDAPPWEDVQEYWRRSPLSIVGSVETPTLLITGEQDLRTPMAESEQYYHALKLRQVDTMLVRIPEASHSIYARPSHLIAKVANILAWFEKYRDKPTDEAASR